MRAYIEKELHMVFYLGAIWEEFGLLGKRSENTFAPKTDR